MSEPYIGEVDLYGFNFAPTHWTECTGTLLAINDNQALFSLVSTYYGGDGRANFAIPDLRGTLPIGNGDSPFYDVELTIGRRIGVETFALTDAQLPIHSHLASVHATVPDPSSTTLYATTDKGTSETVTNGAYLSQSDTQPGAHPDDKPELFYITSPAAGTLVDLGGVSASISPLAATASLANTGSGASFDIIQPIQIVNYCIALTGLYPSRN